MQQDANHTTEQVNEQDLQIATGGCGGCEVITKFAIEDAAKMEKTISKIHPLLREKATKNLTNLKNLGRIGANTTRVFPPEGTRYCPSYDYLKQGYRKHSSYAK